MGDTLRGTRAGGLDPVLHNDAIDVGLLVLLHDFFDFLGLFAGSLLDLLLLFFLLLLGLGWSEVGSLDHGVDLLSW